MENYYLTDFGAIPGGAVSCTAAFAAAVGTCVENGGGRVIVPSGVYLTGPIRLASRVTLFLEPDARVVFSDDPADYPVVESRWEGVEQPVYMPQIYGAGLEDAALAGSGVLDGQGGNWWRLFRAGNLAYPRPRLIGLEECTGFTIRDATLTASPSWTIHPLRCRDLTIDRVTIRNPPDSPNTDGIDPESCRNVRITGCRIDVGDDCIAIKSGEERCRVRTPCEDITVSGCTMAHGHGGVVIGSEMSGGVRRVTIRECVFSGTDRGIRIKSRRGRGGSVEDIRVDGVEMRDVLCPLVINLFYRCGRGGKDPAVGDPAVRPVDEGTPAVRGIHLAGISAVNAGAAAGFFLGLPEMPVADVALEDVSVTMDGGAEPGLPAMMDGLAPMRRRGFLCGHVEGFTFRRVSVTGHEGPAFEIRDAGDVRILGCRAEPVSETDPYLLERVDGACIEEGTDGGGSGSRSADSG